MCSEPAMRAPFSGWVLAELGADGHQARHLGLGDVDLLAAPVGEADVLDDVVGLALGSSTAPWLDGAGAWRPCRCAGRLADPCGHVRLPARLERMGRRGVL